MRAILLLTFFLLGGHAVFPHAHGVSGVSEIIPHPTEKNLLHFLAHVLSADPGPDHLKNLKKNSEYGVKVLPASQNEILEAGMTCIFIFTEPQIPLDLFSAAATHSRAPPALA